MAFLPDIRFAPKRTLEPSELFTLPIPSALQRRWRIAEGVHALIFRVALPATPLRGRRQQFVVLRNATPARQKLHLLPVADLTGDAIDRRSYAVENDDRALCILQNRLVILIRLFAGLKFEVFARFTSPIDLALTVVIGLNVAFEPPKERPRPLPPRRHSRRRVRPRR